LFPGILRCEEIPMDRLRQFAAAPLILLALTLIEPASIAQMDEQSRAIKALIESFERALSTRDMRMLEQLWAHEPYVMVVSPRDKSFSIGWDAVRNHWAEVFEFWSYLNVSLEAEPHIRIREGMAWASSVARAGGQTKAGQPLYFSTLMTDVFENREGRWYMVAHHASRMPE